MAFCHNCGNNVEDGALFCDNCGTRVDENAQPQASPDSIYMAPAEPAPVRKKGFDLKAIVDKIPKNVGKVPTKLLLAGVAGVLVLAIVLSIALPALLSGTGSQDQVFYAKDGEIFLVDNKGKNPWQITDELLDKTSWTEESLAGRSNTLANRIQVRNGGKVVFYLDNVNDNDYGYTIYYRSLTNPKKEPVKIDKEITSFYANEKGTALVYLSNDDLYYRELSAEKEERIAKDVESFYSSPDCKRVLFVDDSDKLYIWTAKNGEEKISGNVTSVTYCNEDMSKVYYLKDDVLHLWTGKEDVKIASDIYNIISITEDGEIYYTVDETEDVDVMDFVSDKFASDDAAMTEPDWSAIRAQYDNYDEASEAYDKAREEYWAKQRRDEVRAALPEAEFEELFIKLYFYDGKESVPVGDGYVHYTNSASEAAVVVYATCDYTTLDVDIDDLGYYPSNLSYVLEEAADENSLWYVATGSKTAPIALEGDGSARLDQKGETVYLAIFYPDEVTVDDNGYENVVSSDEADLYRVAVSGGKAKEPELVDEEIYRNQIYAIDGKTVAYFKDRDDETYEAELFINGESVEDDVYTYYCRMDKENGSLLYMTDMDDDDLGTLKYYHKGKITELGEDVDSVVVFPGGEIYYLADYSDRRSYGDLYYFGGKEPVKLDEDVTVILNVAIN